MLCEACRTRLAVDEIPPIDTAVFDRERRLVIIGDERRLLSPSDWRLLEILWAKREKTVQRASIEILMWGHEIASKNLEVRVHHMRKLLRGTPYRIATVQRVGYRLESAAAPGREHPKAA